jgi:tetratricopeptide (TPR) repeat protein
MHSIRIVGLVAAALFLSACASFPLLAPEAAFQEAIRTNQAEALRLEQAGRLREAIDRWKIVLTIDAHHVTASQRIEQLSTTVREQSQRHVALGKEALQRRDRQAAQRDYLAALRLDPQNLDALQGLYTTDEQLGDHSAFAKPRMHRTRADASPPVTVSSEEEEETGEEMSLAEAIELFRRKEYRAAIDAFSRVLAREPNLREALEYQKLAYYNGGVEYLEKAEYTEALTMFDRLKKLQPDFKRLSYYWRQAREKLAEQHYLAGIHHFKEQQLKEAIQEWDQALALNPNLENAKRSRERANHLLKNLETIR